LAVLTFIVKDQYPQAKRIQEPVLPDRPSGDRSRCAGALHSDQRQAWIRASKQGITAYCPVDQEYPLVSSAPESRPRLSARPLELAFSMSLTGQNTRSVLFLSADQIEPRYGGSQPAEQGQLRARPRARLTAILSCRPFGGSELTGVACRAGVRPSRHGWAGC